MNSIGRTLLICMIDYGYIRNEVVVVGYPSIVDSLPYQCIILHMLLVTRLCHAHMHLLCRPNRN